MSTIPSAATAAPAADDSLKGLWAEILEGKDTSSNGSNARRKGRRHNHATATVPGTPPALPPLPSSRPAPNPMPKQGVRFSDTTERASAAQMELKEQPNGRGIGPAAAMTAVSRLLHTTGLYGKSYAAVIPHLHIDMALKVRATNVALFPLRDDQHPKDAVPSIVELRTYADIQAFNLQCCSGDDYRLALMIAVRMLQLTGRPQLPAPAPAPSSPAATPTAEVKAAASVKRVLYYADLYVGGMMRGVSSVALKQSGLIGESESDRAFDRVAVVCSDDAKTDDDKVNEARMEEFRKYLAGPMCKLPVETGVMSADEFYDRFKPQSGGSDDRLVIWAGYGIPNRVFDSDVFPAVDIAFGFVRSIHLFQPSITDAQIETALRAHHQQEPRGAAKYSDGMLQKDKNDIRQLFLASCLTSFFYCTSAKDRIAAMGHASSDAARAFADRECRSRPSCFGEFDDFLVMIRLKESRQPYQQAVISDIIPAVSDTGKDPKLVINLDTTKGAQAPTLAIWTVKRLTAIVESKGKSRTQLACEVAVHMWRAQVALWNSDFFKVEPGKTKADTHRSDALGFFSKFMIAGIGFHENHCAMPRGQTAAAFGYCFRYLTDGMNLQSLASVADLPARDSWGDHALIYAELEALPCSTPLPVSPTTASTDVDASPQQSAGGGGRGARGRGRGRGRRERSHAGVAGSAY